MLRSREDIFIVIYILIQLVSLNNVKADGLPVVESFSKDWSIPANEILLYSRSFNRHHEFAYASSNGDTKRSQVKVIRAETSDYHERTCKMVHQGVSSVNEGELGLYLPDKGNVESEHVAQFIWFEQQNRIITLDLRSCMIASLIFLPELPKDNHPTSTRVIPYSFPNFDVVYTDPDGKKRVQSVFSLAVTRRSFRPIGGRAGPAWNLKTKFKGMIGETGVEFEDSSRGFFYLGTDGQSDSKLSVMYVNSTSQQQRDFGEINYIDDSTKDSPKTSGAHKKYGVCWSNATESKKLSCVQFDHTGQKIIPEMSFEVPQDFQWMAVHNLEGSAMLIATGTYDDDTCNEFYVTKIQADGQKSTSIKIDNFSVQSPDSPADLTVDVAEDPDKNVICFNFVSLNNKQKDPSDEETNKKLQYQRYCFSKNDIEKMIL